MSATHGISKTSHFKNHYSAPLSVIPNVGKLLWRCNISLLKPSIFNKTPVRWIPAIPFNYIQTIWPYWKLLWTYFMQEPFLGCSGSVGVFQDKDQPFQITLLKFHGSAILFTYKKTCKKQKLFCITSFWQKIINLFITHSPLKKLCNIILFCMQIRCVCFTLR